MSNPLPAIAGPERSQPPRLLAPAIALMNRLSYPRKFALISLLFVLPLALVMWLLLSEIDDRIDFARKETQGIRYFLPLRALLQDVSQSRVLAHDYAAGHVSARPQLIRKGEEIDSDVAALAAVEGQLGAGLQTASHFRVLQENWRFLHEKMLGLDGAGLDDLHAQLQGDIQALTSQLRDTSNLILDPDLDSYYLMDALLIKLPEAAHLSAQARLQGKKALVRRQPLSAEDRASFLRLGALLRLNLDQTQSALRVAFRSQPAQTLKLRLEAPLQAYVTATERLLETLDRDIVRPQTPAVTPSSYDDLAREHLEKNLALADGTAHELDGLLHARINGLTRKKRFIEAFALLTLLLVAYLLLAFRASVLRTVGRLEEAAQRMVSGEVAGTIDLETRDELGQVVGSFNKIATRLRGEWAQAREESERARAAEEELRKAKEISEVASRAKSEFLAVMSHEIRTPMNGIIGMTELALGTSLTAEQREYLGIVQASAESLLTIINDILDFSKVEAGKLELIPGELGLRDSLGETLKTLALRAHQKGLELAYRVAPDVPDLLVGDLARLRQVVVNLVGNAIKFTDHGEVVVSVTTEEEKRGTTEDTENTQQRQNIPQKEQTDRPNRQEPLSSASSPSSSLSSLSSSVAPSLSSGVTLHFEVRDTGVGIPRDKQEVIFNPFEQVDSSRTRRYGGTGLGLAISSRLVEMMGGRLWVESEVGRGSTFHFTARFGLGRGVAAGPLEADPTSLRDLSVLVVDDNDTNRRILNEVLRGWYMRPTLVDCAAAALAELQRAAGAGEPFPLILLDCQMPGMDGLTLAREIRQRPDLAGVTVLMLLSSDPHSVPADREELGITASLTKPIKQSDLLPAILQALRVQHAPPEETRPLQVARVGPSLHILLAEDNVVNQKLATRLLQTWGHRAVVAHNGREALDALERDRFDVVLMDVQMPEVDGFEATAALREREKGTGRHTPVLALTAHAMKGDRERCLSAGMDGYLTKPIRSEELSQALRELVPAASSEPSVGHPLASAEEEPVDRSGTPEAVFDREAALEGVGKSETLLREIAELFLEHSPRMLAEARAALDQGDVPRLKRAVHTLVGSLSSFGAGAAETAARRLEALVEVTELDGREQAYQALEHEVRRLQQALVGYLSPASG